MSAPVFAIVSFLLLSLDAFLARTSLANSVKHIHLILGMNLNIGSVLHDFQVQDTIWL